MHIVIIELRVQGCAALLGFLSHSVVAVLYSSLSLCGHEHHSHCVITAVPGRYIHVYMYMHIYMCTCNWEHSWQSGGEKAERDSSP